MSLLAEQIQRGLVEKTSLCFIGQAGFILKSKSGKLLAVDLYLTDCCERKYGFKRLMPKVLTPSDIVFDVVVCTHEHYDHFDVDAIPLMLSNPVTSLVAARDCRKLVKRLELDDDAVIYLSAGENCTVSDFHIDAVFCDHGSNTPDAIGLIITVDGKKIYFSGDTCLRLDKIPVIANYGFLDVMIAPINGAFGNMNESEMVQLCKELNPGLVIPCHYWNFAEHGGNPGLFMECMQNMCPSNRYRVMAMGEMVEL